mgnify:CR=1 FL=1
MNVRMLSVNAVFLMLPALLAACSDAPRPPAVSFRIQNVPPVPRTMAQMSREVHINRDFMSPRSRARRAAHSMHPRFITIHSTANPRGDAAAHARALKRGAMGSLNWHFTVDQYRAVQHIPLNETGRHADRGGPGDMYSIGIEMCEKRGQSIVKTFDRAAKLAAYNMYAHDIPLRNVVPHYYWTGKRCPHLLLDNGKPGFKWSWFISRVDYYYRCIS